jgi:hypothetical protein
LEIEAMIRAEVEEAKVTAEERKTRRDSASAREARTVLERADSGKSLKELADASRRRRSSSIGSQKKRSGSNGPKRRTSTMSREGGTTENSKRFADIEAQIKAEEHALTDAS